jgi:hypothetical protein
MLIQRAGVLFRLLEDTLHYGITDDRHQFWVALDTLHRLLLRLAIPRGVHDLHTLSANVFDLAGVLVLSVSSGSLVAGVETLVVVLHGEIDLGFTDVGAHEFGVYLDSEVAVFDGFGKGDEFLQGSSTVGVTAGVLGCALDHLRVCLDGASKVGGFEETVTFLTGFVGLCGVDVSVSLFLNLLLLGVAELG